ncbi:MAG TPA: hypothetical protein VFO49_17670 [Nocardioides sp.]|nr:hypothetical protein [Nocardioides sp.]
MFVLAACGDTHVVEQPGSSSSTAPAVASEAGSGSESGSRSASGRTWTTLDTHCGVLSAHVDGRLWIADPPIGDHDPPPGWGENETSGFFSAGRGRAVFRGEGGQVALFRRARPSEPDPAASCE